MTTSNYINITPLLQFGIQADVAEAICETFYNFSKSSEELDDMHFALIEEIAIVRGLV